MRFIGRLVDLRVPASLRSWVLSLARNKQNQYQVASISRQLLDWPSMIQVVWITPRDEGTTSSTFNSIRFLRDPCTHNNKKTNWATFKLGDTPTLRSVNKRCKKIITVFENGTKAFSKTKICFGPLRWWNKYLTQSMPQNVKKFSFGVKDWKCPIP